MADYTWTTPINHRHEDGTEHAHAGREPIEIGKQSISGHFGDEPSHGHSTISLLGGPSGSSSGPVVWSEREEVTSEIVIAEVIAEEAPAIPLEVSRTVALGRIRSIVGRDVHYEEGMLALTLADLLNLSTAIGAADKVHDFDVMSYEGWLSDFLRLREAYKALRWPNTATMDEYTAEVQAAKREIEVDPDHLATARALLGHLAELKFGDPCSPMHQLNITRALTAVDYPHEVESVVAGTWTILVTMPDCRAVYIGPFNEDGSPMDTDQMSGNAMLHIGVASGPSIAGGAYYAFTPHAVLGAVAKCLDDGEVEGVSEFTDAMADG